MRSSLPLLRISAPLTKNNINGYKFMKKIGQGGFATVVKAVRIKTQEEFAIKIFPKSNLTSKDQVERFQHEIDTMHILNHENIVKLHDFFWDDLNFYLVLDYCEGGDLTDFLLERERIPECIAACFFAQILSAVAYCHSFGVVHRDLKPANICIAKFPQIKVTDFGLCGFFSRNTLMSTFCGSPKYISPECLSKVQYDGRLSDIWSLGVLLFVLVTGTSPWRTENTTQMLQNIMKGKYILPEYLSPTCKDIISGMIQVQPADRLSIQKLMNHPWLMNNRNIQNLPINDLVMPEIQPLSVADLSDHSSCSSTRSNSGIFSPFDDEDEDCDKPIQLFHPAPSLPNLIAPNKAFVPLVKARINQRKTLSTSREPARRKITRPVFSIMAPIKE